MMILHLSRPSSHVLKKTRRTPLAWRKTGPEPTRHPRIRVARPARMIRPPLKRRPRFSGPEPRVEGIWRVSVTESRLVGIGRICYLKAVLGVRGPGPSPARRRGHTSSRRHPLGQVDRRKLESHRQRSSRKGRLLWDDPSCEWTIPTRETGRGGAGDSPPKVLDASDRKSTSAWRDWWVTASRS